MNSHRHILVVEDEEHLALGIKYNLEAEGYQVTTVKDGRTALDAVESQRIPVDLVILDLMLPGMSGYAVCEAIRNSHQDLPVLILSARTLTEDRTRGFDAGANQYLTKPFDLEELLSRVKNLLQMHLHRSRRRAGDEIHQFQFGRAQVNFDAHEVTVDDKGIRMTQLEIKLLKYFVQNADRVIPRQELLEEVWDMPSYANTRAPDQFIRRLRKIFEDDPAQPRHFLTIRDVGYRFVRDGAEARGGLEARGGAQASGGSEASGSSEGSLGQ